jgi:hypothetical protein
VPPGCTELSNSGTKLGRIFLLGGTDMIGWILLIILILLLVGLIPAWPYSRGWGYFPSGIVGLLLIILLILLLLGRFPA